jgi:hypothetical protein
MAVHRVFPATIISILSASFMATGAGPARAHLGHVGELAGHGHWVGVAALGTAVAVAAALAARKRRQAKPSRNKQKAKDKAAA